MSAEQHAREAAKLGRRAARATRRAPVLHVYALAACAAHEARLALQAAAAGK